MKRSFKWISIFSLGLVTVLFYACDSKKAVSKPQFIFKSAPDSKTVAKVGSVTISKGELEKGIENELYEAELKVYEIKMNRLRALLLEKFMNKDPSKKNMTNDEYMEKHIAKNIKVTDADINAFIKERKVPAEHVNDQFKSRVRDFLTMEKKKQAADQWIAQQTAKTPVEVYFNEPNRPSFDIPLEKDVPSMGPDQAKVTIVEFSDFQCPYCQKASETVHEIKKKYGKKVRVVFKNYPLPFHRNAKTAAVAGMCAYEQGNDKFWKMHDAMFEDQQSLDEDGLLSKAKNLGLDYGKFAECLKGKKYLPQIEKDMELGKNIGVKSTPTFFVNGKLLMGAQPLDVFSELIDKELAL